MTTPEENPWTPPDDDVVSFLDDYDLRGRDGGDWSGVFSGTFLALDPQRALALTPRQLGAGLPARRKMFTGAGVTALRRVSARQQRLDDRHVLVRAEWLAERPIAPVALASTFLLRREADHYEIAVYLNHNDLALLLAEPFENDRSTR
ncbi:hypothetical protein [Umezawaea sp. NPDC059074]|uniref:hypothetical protein n=1 Tax=Umezawaea sp. NPDC059074 TaxID=3346716 RepID=UPI0036D1F78A